ncbi:MAG: NADH-quinone oxidoreductase subunit NuoH [Elusimicrobia bacterium]|nr:NADH-quinone oxidoreductase subunit NuoH [Elusimicrobiota bacterium]
MPTASTRYWPTQLWKDPWRNPSYRRGAALLAAILLGILLLGILTGELQLPGERLYRIWENTLLSLGLSAIWVDPGWMLVKALIILHIILFNGLFLVWWERKISAHIQSRLGPTRVGGWHGWAQTIADGVKLLLKEDITPAAADPWVHWLAPVIALSPVILCFAPVAFGTGLAAVPLETGILYIFALTGITVIGIVMGGWAGGSKYSILGGLRSAAQLVSYELPRAFSVVPVLMLAGSLNLTRIVEAQSGYWLGIFPQWFLFYPVVGQLSFLIFLIASVAETNRIPFDIPEAESELVAGFHTEYSGMKFSLLFLGEYAYVLLSSCLVATFFLGGGLPPLPFLGFIPSWIWFFGKTLAIVFCFLWFRWTFPRFRVDRLMDFNWKFLLPWSFANIALAGLYLL